MPVVVPAPIIKLPPPPAITAAPLPALGPDAAAGAAAAGEGTGAGGQGNGRGSGSGGNGTGSGGTRARLIRGEISGRDYPPEAKAAHIEGNLTTRYSVDAKGRIERCYVTEFERQRPARCDHLPAGDPALPLRSGPRRRRQRGYRRSVRGPRLAHLRRAAVIYSAASSRPSSSAACSAHISA